MSKFNYKYYRDTYCGMLDETVFSRYSPTSCDVISMLVGCDCEVVEDEAVLRALCLETDHLAREMQQRDRISRETLGDYSVSYDRCDEDAVEGIAVNSCPVSAEVIAALTRSGFLTRWA